MVVAIVQADVEYEFGLGEKQNEIFEQSFAENIAFAICQIDGAFFDFGDFKGFLNYIDKKKINKNKISKN